jgi:hypothetical protein
MSLFKEYNTRPHRFSKPVRSDFNIHLIILLIIGVVLRFTISFTHSYSSDELSAITRLNFDGLSDILEFGVMKGDMHPAGVQLFEEFWSSIFGASEIALRFPFVLMGVLAIWLTYLIGKTYLNKKSGIIAATLLTVMYFPILNSELARPYSPGLLFSLMVAWFWFRVLFPNGKTSFRQAQHNATTTKIIESSENKWLRAIGLGVSFALAMYTHYFAFMFVGFIGVTGLFFIKKETILSYLTAAAIGVLLFLPHLEITIFHLSIDGGLQWLARPDKTWLFQFIFHAFNESWLVLSTVILVSFVAVIKGLNEQDKTNRKSIFIFALWFFGIYIVGHIFSYVSSPILKFPVMLFALPFFFLLIGSLFSKLDNQKFNILFIVLILISGSSTLIEKDLYGNKHFGVFKEIAEPMVDWRTTYGAGNINTFMNVSNPNYLNYYATQLGDSLTFDRDVMGFSEDISIREELINSDKPYCIVGYSARLTLPQIFETCKEFYPVILDYKKLNNCAVFLLAKSGESIDKSEHKELTTFYSKQINTDWNYDTLNHKIDSHNRLIYYSDSTQIYGPDYIFKKQDINVDYDYYLKITINAKAVSNSQLTVSLSAKRNGELVTNKKGDNIWEGHDLETMLNNPIDNNKSYFALQIPKQIKDTDDIQVSLWNRNGSPVNIYSIKIEVIENIWN